MVLFLLKKIPAILGDIEKVNFKYAPAGNDIVHNVQCSPGAIISHGFAVHHRADFLLDVHTAYCIVHSAYCSIHFGGIIT